MCTGAEIGLAVSLLSAGAGAVNQNQALKRSDRQQAAGIRQQGVRQKEATTRVGKTLQETEQSNGEAERQTANSNFMDALRRSAAGQRGTQSVVPGASTQFNTDAATAQAQTGDYGSQLADLFSRIDAPNQQRVNENAAAGRAAIDVGQIQRNASGDDFISRLKASAIQPNPWVALGSKVGQNVGIGLSMRGAGATAGSILRNPGADPTIVDRLRQMRSAGQAFA